MGRHIYTAILIVLMTAQYPAAEWLSDRADEFRQPAPYIVSILAFAGETVPASERERFERILHRQLASHDYFVLSSESSPYLARLSRQSPCLSLDCLDRLSSQIRTDYIVIGTTDLTGECMTICTHLYETRRSAIVCSGVRECSPSGSVEESITELAAEMNDIISRNDDVSIEHPHRTDIWQVSSQVILGATSAGFMAIPSFIEFSDLDHDPGFLGMPLYAALGAATGAYYVSKIGDQRVSFWFTLGGALAGSVVGWGGAKAVGIWDSDRSCEFCKEKAFATIIIFSTVGAVSAERLIRNIAHEPLFSRLSLPTVRSAVASNRHKPAFLVDFINVSF